jgi:hypothetical protein
MTSLESEELDRTETMQKRRAEDDLREKRQKKVKKVKKKKREKVSPREF